MDRKIMEYKGFKAQIMEAIRLKGYHTYGLPPGDPLYVYHADEFNVLPEQWIKGPGVFIVPVRPEKGLWFNWRDNDELNTAVIPTVKGCNPITGLQTSGFHLEQYESKCPKHGCDFLADRFCPECSYKWENRNYISKKPLWWDGYRANDGTVRQFFFTSDSMRDVASALIGKENTVPAFGFAFYTPKEKREIKIDNRSRGIDVSLGETSLVFDKTSIECSVGSSDLSEGPPVACAGGPMNFSEEPSILFVNKSSDIGSTKFSNAIKTKSGGHRNYLGGSLKKSQNSRGIPRCAKDVTKGIFDQSDRRKSVISKEVSIGAGAKIRQKLNDDPYPLDSWNGTPDAVMTIYFVFHEKFEELKAGGMRDLSGKSEGMLNGIPVG